MEVILTHWFALQMLIKARVGLGWRLGVGHSVRVSHVNGRINASNNVKLSREEQEEQDMVRGADQIALIL